MAAGAAAHGVTVHLPSLSRARFDLWGAGDVASLAALACRRVCVPSALAAVDERIAATQSALDVPRLAAICEDRRVQRLDCED